MSEVKVIGIGNDHAAVDLKNEIKAYLEEKGYKVVNYGTDSSESCDYPVYGQKQVMLLQAVKQMQVF